MNINPVNEIPVDTTFEIQDLSQIQRTQQQQAEALNQTPKQLQGREVKLSPRTKAAMGFAALSALAFSYYAAYNYLSPTENYLSPTENYLSPTENSKPYNPTPRFFPVGQIKYHTCSYSKASEIERQITPIKDPENFCMDPKTLFNEIYESHNFKAISVSDMEKRFGIDKRSMTAAESREFYNVIAKANREFGQKALLQIKQPSTSDILWACCETRHNAKVYTRELSGHIAEIYSMGYDFLRHFSTTGQDCLALFKKYDYNDTVIVDKAGSPNNEINRLVEQLDRGVFFAISTELKNRIISPIADKVIPPIARYMIPYIGSI